MSLRGFEKSEVIHNIYSFFKNWIATPHAARNDNENNFIILNLVKTILTSINFDSLSERNLCLVIKKFYSKGVCNMKHTKNILKSLLITVMALSLLAVSCKKDEGGSKPTDPTPKNSEALLTEMLRRLGQLKGTEQADKDTVMVDLSNINPENGNAAISGADNTKNEGTQKYKVVEVLENTFKKANFQSERIGLNADLTVTPPTGGNKNELPVDITFIANKGYTFDDSIINGKAYTYDKSAKTAKLTLKITPAKDWE